MSAPKGSPWRNQTYAAIWLANAVSVLGDWLHAMALMVLVYDLTGSGLAVGVMLASKVLPALFMGAVAGVLADRWDRKWIMIGSDMARFLLVLGFLFVRTPAGVWLVIALNILLSTASSLFRPARAAAVACVMPKDQLVTANGWLEGTSNIVMLMGTLAGGVLAGAIGPYNVFLLNAASFLTSGLILLVIPGQRPLPVPGTGHDLGPGAPSGGMWREFVAGLRHVVQDRVTLFLIVFYSLWILGVGMSSVVMVVFASDVWNVGTAAVSYLYAAVGAGSIIGALATRAVSNRLQPIPLLIGGIAFVGVLDTLFGLSNTLVIGCTLLFLAGICDGLLTVANDTTLMRRMSQAFIGRVFSVYGALTTTSNVVGMLVSGVVNDTFGARAVMISSGLYMLVLAVPALLVSRRMLRRGRSEAGTAKEA